MTTLFIALGTNLGNRTANLNRALEALPPEIKVMEASPIYETPPWGFENQPAFLNMAARTETGLGPEDALDHIKHIEALMGRESTFRYGPRLIDLDILFYDSLVYKSDRLTIPHPNLHERAFVLVPLNDLAPGFIHPVLDQPVRTLLAELPPGERTAIHVFTS